MFRNGNPYHNNLHAADVLQTTHWFISQAGLKVKCNVLLTESSQSPPLVLALRSGDIQHSDLRHDPRLRPLGHHQQLPYPVRLSADHTL